MKQILVILSFFWSSLVLANQVYDPTKPKQIYVATEEQVVDEVTAAPVDILRLQGILNKKNYRVAFIAGELYSKGDRVEGYLISQINSDHVVIQGSGTQKRLYVYE